MKKKLILALYIAAMTFPQFLHAEVQSIGTPLISNYSNEDYKAHPQNWALSQDLRGILYVANNSGILEFDGNSWRVFYNAKKSRNRSLCLGQDGIVYVGGVGEFGFLAPDGRGETNYVSLLPKVPAADRKFNDVWDIVCAEGRIVFLTDVALFILENGSFYTIRAKNYFYKAFTVENRIYVLESGRGLFCLRGNSLELLPDGQLLAKEKISVMLPFAAGEILVGLRNGKLLVYRPENKPGTAIFTPDILVPLSTVLSGKTIYCGTMVDDQHYALGTLEDGIYVFSRTGILRQHLTKESGLKDNGILYLFMDRGKNLWTAMENGLARIEITSPFSILDERCGVSGSGLSALLLQPPSGKRTRLYLGTGSNLFFADLQLPMPRFSRIHSQSIQVFDLLACDDRVFCADNNGILAITEQQTLRFAEPDQAFRLLPLRNRPNTILVGTMRGFYLLKKNGESWQTTALSGLREICRFFCEDNDGSIWLYYEYRGVQNIRLSPQLDRVISSRLYTVADGLPENSANNFCYWHKRIVVFTRKGFYNFDRKQKRFVPDGELNPFLEEKGEVQPVAADSAGNLWFQENGRLAVIRSLPDGKLTIERTPLRKMVTKSVNNLIAPLNERFVLFGIPEGYMLFDQQAAKSSPLPFSTMLRLVENQATHTPIYLGSGPLPSAKEHPIFPYRRNSLRFVYAAPFFENIPQIEYRYYLRGFTNDWSSWGSQNQNEYTNLPAGNYIFNVQARNIYRTLAAPVQFYFRILPPWYQTIPAYIAYLLLGVLIIVGSVKWYTRKLKQEKIKLEKLVSEKTQELKEASLTDPLTGLRNRRFLSEVLSTDIAAFLKFKKYAMEAKDRRDAKGNEKLVFGLFIFDIDHFKMVNDQYGHNAGDCLLKQFAGILRNAVREDDAVLRIGGEEFLIILKRTVPEYLDTFATKIGEKIAGTEFVVNDETVIQRTCSIGYTQFPFYESQPTQLNFEQTLMVADLALYYAKTHGRKRAIAILPGAKIPAGKEINKMTTSLDFGLEKGFYSLRT